MSVFTSYNVPGNQKYNPDYPLDVVMTSNKDPLGVSVSDSSWAFSKSGTSGIAMDTDGTFYISDTSYDYVVRLDTDSLPYVAPR